MVSLQEKDKRRFQILSTAYEEVDGKEKTHFNYLEIGKRLGLEDEETRNIVLYLKEEGLVENTTPALASMSHQGIKEVEEAQRTPEKPTLHFPANINIGRMNVTGTVNFGQIVGNIHEHITQIKNSGNVDLADSLNELIQAAEKDQSLTEDQKQEFAENIELIAEEAEREPHERRVSRVKATLKYVPSIINTSAALVTLWDQYIPVIVSYFGISL